MYLLLLLLEWMLLTGGIQFTRKKSDAVHKKNSIFFRTIFKIEQR